ncbi:MAG: DNA-binding protein [Crocinitomicaceae bacterium]|nr:DNA-binding protein [Crocinitomicaceae bacterium]|tara:strand:+ start:2072 stop:2473 length:402 start_codon:yes stop_codon:yes gene_type:complete
MSDYGNENREELYSVRVRAGKRTYFFDVKETRGKDLYMTITESKRNFDNDGNIHYQKHKLFLYREDFEKFEDGFIDATDKIKELMTTGEYRDPIAERNAAEGNSENDYDSDSEKNAEDTSETTSEDEVEFDDL